LAFVMDSSGSINDVDSNTWSRMRNFVSAVIQQFHISSDTAHIGLVQYSNTAQVILRLSFIRSNNTIGRLVLYVLI